MSPPRTGDSNDSSDGDSMSGDDDSEGGESFDDVMRLNELLDFAEFTQSEGLVGSPK